MRVFVVPQVARLMRKERLPAAALCRAASEIVAGMLGAGEAELGGGLFKMRLARPGGGKRSGYRMVVAYRPAAAERALFIYGFAKNAASTLTPQGQDALAKVADRFLRAEEAQIALLLASGEVDVVTCDADEPV